MKLNRIYQILLVVSVSIAIIYGSLHVYSEWQKIENGRNLIQSQIDKIESEKKLRENENELLKQQLETASIQQEIAEITKTQLSRDFMLLFLDSWKKVLDSCSEEIHYRIHAELRTMIFTTEYEILFFTNVTRANELFEETRDKLFDECQRYEVSANLLTIGSEDIIDINEIAIKTLDSLKLEKEAELSNIGFSILSISIVLTLVGLVVAAGIVLGIYRSIKL